MALRESEKNFLALSVAPVFATRWLLPRLKNFYAQNPEINLSVIATPDLVNFRSDPFDVAIRMGHGHWPNTISKRLFTKRIVAACHPDLFEKNSGTFAIEELTKQPLIHNSSMKGLWLEWMSSAGVVPPNELSGIEVQGTAQVLEAISSGDAIGLVDLSFVGNDLDAGRLVLASEHVLSGDDGYFLTYPEATSEQISLQRFEQWIFSEVDPE
ncbi:LysR substrate-binding domain-containing protein [Neptunomonas qingdaonensis]|uniref:LysR family transcriptional regulator, glycine cleavage system transcriptional activator n=1 Tax=Neptunomonas qingdaonensis TaxID=1045558 RepID=A0A1I2V0V3_9GAMM|nr:LysR substrate-binding domain-containing protein [Neptunomonas qingdaonensis]SFG82988.1 LysR family transcriptional regulator, glycine cleavage system transcriptional activator [Neptunomonas qingdaonensis]